MKCVLSCCCIAHCWTAADCWAPSPAAGIATAPNHFNRGNPNTTMGDPGVGVITTGNEGRTQKLSLKLAF